MSGQSSHILRRIGRTSQSRMIAESLIQRPLASGVRRIATLGQLLLASGSLEVSCLECGARSRHTARDLVSEHGEAAPLGSVRMRCAACESLRVMVVPVELTTMHRIPDVPAESGPEAHSPGSAGTAEPKETATVEVPSRASPPVDARPAQKNAVQPKTDRPEAVQSGTPKGAGTTRRAKRSLPEPPTAPERPKATRAPRASRRRPPAGP